MRIVHLLYSLGSGGAERFVVDLSNRQASLGHSVTVCMIRPLDERNGFNAQFLDKGIKIIQLKLESGINFAKMLAVKKAIMSLAPDIVHCHHNVIPYLVALLCDSRCPAIVHTIHSAAERANTNIIERYYCKWLYRKKRVIPVAISEWCRESFIRVYKTDAVCINNGREEPKVSAAISTVKKWIAEKKSSSNTKVFVHVGRFHPVKNQELLIDVFNALNKEGEDFILLVIGAGFDSEQGRALQAKACNTVFFLGETDNVADYLSLSDAFCLTSLSEGLPISLLEAISCGSTPICTAVGGVSDVVIEGKTGYLAEDVSSDSYLKAIHRYLCSPLDRTALQHYYAGHFSMEQCCSHYMDLYKNILR